METIGVEGVAGWQNMNIMVCGPCRSRIFSFDASKQDNVGCVTDYMDEMNC
jgi:hypothetical protein